MDDPAQPQPNATDIPAGNWVDRRAPIRLRPYLRLARLDRPIGTWLLLLPCWWSLALALPDWTTRWPLLLGYGALFGLGAIIMRGAGCTANDLADRNFDGKVARTANRPIPSGDVTPFQALLFLAGLLALGLLILAQFNLFAIGLGMASLVLVFSYPFAKRITYWPQAVLGLTFNWGALLGWATIHEGLSLAPVLMYAAGFFWTLGYDTIYAHQDKEDDLFIGVKSTALRLGDATPSWLIGFYGATTALMAASGWVAGLGWGFYVGLALAASHLGWQVLRVDINDAKECLAKFKSNRDFGLLITAAVLAGQVSAL